MLMFDAVTPSMPHAGPPGTSGPGTGGTTKFSVDPDQAQKMIDGLQAAIDHLITLRTTGSELTQSGAPGPDPYSGWATLEVRKAAGEQAGGYVWANDAAVKALEQTILNIKKSLAEYRGTDDAAKTAVKG